MPEFDAIEEVIADYVTGMSRGDRALLDKAFHPKACSVGHFDGDLEWADLDAFAAACVGAAIAAADPVPGHRIESISVAGDTAVVHVFNVWAGLDFRDILTLLHHEGRWQIVSKVFLHLK